MIVKDFEEYEDFVVGEFQSDLNTFIGDINTDKDDGITLDTIPSADFFSWPRELAVDKNTFLLYRMGTPTLTGVAPHPLVFTIPMDFFIVFNNVDQTEAIIRSKLFRYGLALQKVVNKMSANRKNGLAIATGSSYPPGLYQFDGAKDNYKKASGVSLTGDLPNC